MKTRGLALIFSSGCLFFATLLKAQEPIEEQTYGPIECEESHYSAYRSVTLDSTYHKIVQTVTISGYTEALAVQKPNGSWSTAPCVAELNSHNHQAVIRSTASTTGGTTSQAPQVASAHIIYSTTISTPDISYGTPSETGGYARILCGLETESFFDWGFGDWWEIAYTRGASLGTVSNCTSGPSTTTCDLDVTLWCTASSTPPDMNITKVRVTVYPISPSPYYDAFGLGLRLPGSTGPFIFNSLTTYAVGLPSPQSLAICTKTQ